MEWGCRRRLDPHNRRSEQLTQIAGALRYIVPLLVAIVGVIAAIVVIQHHETLVRWLYVALGVAVVALAAIGVMAVGEARLEHKREQFRLKGLLLAPFATLAEIDPTQIGVDAAAQTVLAGHEVPEYLPRKADHELRAAARAALDDRRRWSVVAVGPSKTGKSRALFEALRHADEQTELELLAPVDADALRSLTTPGEMPKRRRKPVCFGWMILNRSSTRV